MKYLHSCIIIIMIIITIIITIIIVFILFYFIFLNSWKELLNFRGWQFFFIEMKCF